MFSFGDYMCTSYRSYVPRNLPSHFLRYSEVMGSSFGGASSTGCLGAKEPFLCSSDPVPVISDRCLDRICGDRVLVFVASVGPMRLAMFNHRHRLFNWFQLGHESRNPLQSLDGHPTSHLTTSSISTSHLSLLYHIRIAGSFSCNPMV